MVTTVEMETFRADFLEWEWRLIELEKELPEGVAEIQAAIRADWKKPELCASWIAHVADEARHSRELKERGVGIEQRVKESLRASRAGSPSTASKD